MSNKLPRSILSNPHQIILYDTRTNYFFHLSTDSGEQWVNSHLWWTNC